MSMKANRLDLIEEYILEHGNVSLPELSAVFQVSINTIRRDIAELVQRGKVKKVYGGVTINGKTAPPVSVRENTYSAEKEAIGRLAAPLVRDGDTIYLDSGTTTPFILRNLTSVQSLTIISHSLRVLEEASHYKEFHLIAVGGEYSYRTGDFSGLASSTDTLSRYHISKAFLSATAVSVRFGLSSTSFLEAEIKRSIVAGSDSLILLSDHSKFSRNAVISFCDLEQLEAIVTDCRPSEEICTFCEENQIQLIF